MDIRIKEVINNLKNYDFDILGNYKMDGAEAKKLIEAIEETDKKIADYTYTIGLLQDRIEEIEKSDKWIPVNERLPEDKELVLFSTKTNRVFEGRYFDDNTDKQWYAFREGRFAWNNVVTAWMPLPEPYKAQTNIERGLAYTDQDTLMSAT